jgi:integrase
MGDILYKDVLDQWWAIRRLSLSPSTILSHNRIMNKDVLPTFGDLNILDITQDMLTGFFEVLKKRKTDIKNEHTILRQSFEYAEKVGIVVINPMAMIKLHRERNRPVYIFAPGEVQLLIDNAHPAWFADMIEIGYRTGMRRGEILALQWRDIDFAGKRLMVNQSLSGISAREIYIRPPKSATSKRVISLDNRVLAVLSRLRCTAKFDWVFTRPGGLLQPPTNISGYMRKTCLAAGIPRRNFHALRHTHASILLGMGVHPKVVQERLGHASLIMTLNVYGHLLPAMQDSAVDALNSL